MSQRSRDLAEQRASFSLRLRDKVSAMINKEWQCGTCAYWEKEADTDGGPLMVCFNKEAVERRRFSDGSTCRFTRFDYGCRFWERKPLENKGS